MFMYCVCVVVSCLDAIAPGCEDQLSVFVHEAYQNGDLIISEEKLSQLMSLLGKQHGGNTRWGYKVEIRFCAKSCLVV